MRMLTKAAVARDDSSPLTTKEVNLRAPRWREVPIDIKVPGLCHTDPSIMQDSLPFPLPTILDHESADIARGFARRWRSSSPAAPEHRGAESTA
jgi:Zn-dependent alcohol dehydrogenase